MAATLEDILQAVSTLSPDDRQQLRRTLERLEPPQPAVGPATEEHFHQQLLAAGLVRQRQRPLAVPLAASRSPRVTIVGRPLSVTVVEERR